MAEGGRQAGGGEDTVKVRMAGETSMRDNGKEKEKRIKGKVLCEPFAFVARLLLFAEALSYLPSFCSLSC